jgi:drug/metabolite transporter (DMT)-like permease
VPSGAVHLIDGGSGWLAAAALLPLRGSLGRDLGGAMAVPLALLAALLFAVAGAAEQRAASRVLPSSPGGVRHALRSAVNLVRNPLWAAGWAADGLGFAMQAGAVHVGSLSVVQPLLVTTLLFSLPLAALGAQRRPRWSDWAGAAAACAGLALVLSGRRAAATTDVHQARLLLIALLVAAVAGGLVLVGRTARARAVYQSVAAGMMFGLGAAFTKLVGDSLASRGIAGTATYWAAYALIAVSLTGLVLQQVAFSAGSLPATMAAMTITDPLVSYVLGVCGFGEHAPHSVLAFTGMLAGVALLSTGIGLLARSPLLRREKREPERRREPAGRGQRAEPCLACHQ